MDKWLQRTIIITIIETWTLTWAEQDGRAEEVQATQYGLQPISERLTYHANRTQTIIISSSSITTVLPAFTVNE